MTTAQTQKVLFVIGSLESGGAEQQMAMLAEGLAARGWQCAVFALDGDGSLRSKLDAVGVQIFAMGFLKRSRLGKFAVVVASPFYLWWIARRWRPQVLHAYLPFTNLLGAIVARLARVPRVITSRRGLGTHQDRARIWRVLDRAANALSDAVTCNSEAVCADTIRRDAISPGKIRLIRNGLDLSAFDAVPARDRIRSELQLDDRTTALVTVANLLPYKGHADLLDALSRLDPRLPAHRLFLVGRDDGIGAELRQRIHDLGIQDRVVFLGPRRDVPQLLGGMDIFVLPSHEEGFSNALLEAMAAGLAIVATEVGGNTEALGYGKHGLLVPARNPDALADAIGRAMGGDVATAARRAAAKSFARSAFSVASLVESHTTLYLARAPSDEISHAIDIK